MTTVITVPPSLDDHSFEQVLEQLAPLAADEKILGDARYTRWSSPYGLTALLTLAQTRAGTARYRVEDKVTDVGPGDVLFCAARVAHGFEDNSEDFCVWVLFYGAEKSRPG